MPTASRTVGVRPILDLLADHLSDHHLMRYIAGIWQTDRWFTSPKFMQTQQWAVEQMLAGGADEAEVVEIPADGRTRYENWIMPMAFDCRGGRLEVVEPGYQLLADWTQVPQCVVQWCGPTGPEGIVAPLVLAEALNPEQAGAARGRIVLAAKSGRELRRQFQHWEAAGVVSYFLPDYIPDRDNVTCWTNAWSIHPGGWAVQAGEPQMPGFNLPPSAGKRLADRLAAGERIVVRAWADTRLYEGILPVGTGVIRGADDRAGGGAEEVLLCGHAAEVGADDNSSGCAVMLETIRVLGKLIAAGALPRPRRSIRVLLTSEIYGMLGYSGNRDSLDRTIACLHFDLVGDGPSETRPICLYEQGPTNPTYANELVCLINEAMPSRLGGPNLAFKRMPYTGVADDMIGDPAFGVPCPWVGRPIKNNPGYHSSGDTLHVINPVAMLHSAATAAAYAYFIASAGDEQARWLCDQLVSRARARWVAAPASDAEWLGNYRTKAEARRCAELAVSDSVRASIGQAVERGLPGFDEPLADLGSTPADGPAAQAVGRVTRGVISFQGRDAELLARWPGVNWDTKATSALYWADGRRTIAQLRRLAEAEWAAPIKTDLVALFRDAASCGMVTLNKP